MELTEWLAGLKVGDEVAVCGWSDRSDTVTSVISIQRVARKTATTFCVGHDSFYRVDGMIRGGITTARTRILRPVTAEYREAIRCREAIRNIKRVLQRAEWERMPRLLLLEIEGALLAYEGCIQKKGAEK